MEIVPLEVIIRNFSAGSFCKEDGYGRGREVQTADSGIQLIRTTSWAIRSSTVTMPLRLGLATEEEIDAITKYAFIVNDVMREYFDSLGIELIDFKIEFGRYHGQIILADEVSPDTCRLWDKETHEKLDKDRFRRDLGNVEDAYQEVFRRLGIH